MDPYLFSHDPDSFAPLDFHDAPSLHENNDFRSSSTHYAPHDVFEETSLHPDSVYLKDEVYSDSQQHILSSLPLDDLDDAYDYEYDDFDDELDVLDTPLLEADEDIEDEIDAFELDGSALHPNKPVHIFLFSLFELTSRLRSEALYGLEELALSFMSQLSDSLASFLPSKNLSSENSSDDSDDGTVKDKKTLVLELANRKKKSLDGYGLANSILLPLFALIYYIFAGKSQRGSSASRFGTRRERLCGVSVYFSDLFQ
jgi:hypothetical protein